MVMSLYTEQPGNAGGAAWDELRMMPSPPGTSLGQMDAMSLFSEVVSALGLRPVGIVTPWATRISDMEWDNIPRPDTNVMLWELSDGAVNAATEVTFGSPLPFVAIVTRSPMTTEATRQMWQGTAYSPYETQAVYRQDDAKAVPTILFVHWGERIDISNLPKDVLALEPRAKAVGGSLAFAAQIPVEGSTSRQAPAMPFSQALNLQMAASAPPAPPAPGPEPIPLRPAAEAESLHLGVPIAVGLGAAALGFMLWKRKR